MQKVSFRFEFDSLQISVLEGKRVLLSNFYKFDCVEASVSCWMAGLGVQAGILRGGKGVEQR